MRRSSLFLVSATAFVTLAVLLFTGCRKAKTPEDTGYANDHAMAEQSFDDVQSIADKASAVSSGSSLGYKSTNGGCATVTKTPGTITVDFGPTDCTCRDGRKRRGKIIITYTGA